MSIRVAKGNDKITGHYLSCNKSSLQRSVTATINFLYNVLTISLS